MQRLRLTATLLVLLLTGFQCYAQTQRLAIPAQGTFRLERRTNSHSVKAYCLDRHLVIGEPVKFQDILSGNVAARVRVGSEPPISLSEALKRDLVRIEGAGVSNRRQFSDVDGTQIRFVSNSDEVIQITIGRTLAMGESGASPVDPRLLTPVSESRSDAEFKDIQDRIWNLGIAESQLEALNFYGSGKVVRNPQTTRRAIKAFQKAAGIPQTGVLNAETKEALRLTEQKESLPFAEAGFTPSRSDTSVASIADSIRDFESFLNLPKTGKLTESLRAELNNFKQKYRAQIQQALFIDNPIMRQPDAETLKAAPDVLTFQKGLFELKNGGDSEPLSITGMLFRNSNQIEFWERVNESFVSRSMGADALTEMDSLSATIAAAGFGEDTLTVYSHLYKAGDKVRVQLGRQQLEFSESEMATFIEGKPEASKFDEAVEQFIKNRAGRARVVVFRSALSELQASDNKTILNQFGYSEQDPLALSVAMQRKYGNKAEVVLASDQERAYTNMRNVPKLKAGSQIGLYVDNKLKLSAETIEPIKPDLETAKIKVLKVGDDATNQTRIFLFANHADEDFRQTVLKMAEDGHFKNGLIALAVCGGTGCEAQFNSLLIRKSGARAVIFYNQEITAQAVQDVLLKFAEVLKREGAPDGNNYHELWRLSVDEVMKTATPNEKVELLKLRDIIIQVSAIVSQPSLNCE